jgi:hypothetical protein
MHGEAIAVPDHGDRSGEHLGSGVGVERYQLWPGAFIDGVFSIPDEVLIGLWREMESTGKHRDLFYSGVVTTSADWVDWIKSPSNYPVFVVDTTRVKIVAIGWLNHVGDGCALAHFCILGMPRAEIGIVVLQYWSNVKVLEVLVGFTPETNRGAVRYAEKIGFKRTGYIPRMCNMVYDGRRVGAVITTYLMQKEA